MSEKKSLGAEEIVTDRKFNRRSAMGLLAAGAATAAGAVGLLGTTACCVTGGGTPARVACSDTDPTDPAGAGRTCGGAAPAGGRRVCSDSDPTDPAGAGSHC